MDIITLIAVVILSVTVWSHKGKIKEHDKKIERIEQGLYDSLPRPTLPDLEKYEKWK